MLYVVVVIMAVIWYTRAVCMRAYTSVSLRFVHVCWRWLYGCVRARIHIIEREIYDGGVDINDGTTIASKVSIHWRRGTHPS